jgi:imidazole glycerol phosphate synthase subunit HisF
MVHYCSYTIREIKTYLHQRNIKVREVW